MHVSNTSSYRKELTSGCTASKNTEKGGCWEVMEPFQGTGMYSGVHIIKVDTGTQAFLCLFAS